VFKNPRHDVQTAIARHPSRSGWRRDDSVITRWCPTVADAVLGPLLQWKLQSRVTQQLALGGPLISFRPRRCGLVSAEMPRNRLSKGNDLIEGAMM
jgi:hypothetical protein